MTNASDYLARMDLIAIMGAVPNVSIGSGVVGPDGREERITEYLCDSPGCPNVATQMVGCVMEIRFCIALCDEHAGQFGPKP